MSLFLTLFLIFSLPFFVVEDVLSNPASRSSYDAAQGRKRRREEPKKSQVGGKVSSLSLLSLFEPL